MINGPVEEVIETVEALARKVRASIMGDNPEAARTYCEALRDACSGLASLVEVAEEEDD